MYIVLDDWRTWAPQFRDWIKQRFSPHVLESFTRDAEPSWLEWLDTQQAAVDGRRQDSTSLFRTEVLERYTGVRVFHASRIANLETVREDGLRAWSSEELSDSANHLSEGVDPQVLKQAIATCDPQTRGGYVYSFASLHHALGDPVDETSGSLPDFCRHGGEFLTCVRRQLGQQDLGCPEPTTAYIFACDLPWDLLEAEDTDYFAKTMLLTSLTDAYIGEGFSMHGENSCVTTSRGIPSKNISLFAEVDNLLDRNDLRIEDIHWIPFHADH